MRARAVRRKDGAFPWAGPIVSIVIRTRVFGASAMGSVGWNTVPSNNDAIVLTIFCLLSALSSQFSHGQTLVSHLTLGVSCCWKPERGTSGGWKQSAARPCWAQGLVRGCAVETPPADRPQDAVRTPWEPTAVPDTHTSRRFQVVRDPASGASPARHPPRPARRDPRGPPAPAARVRAATLFLPVSWRHARRAAESLRALEERRPASGGAPRRDATPVQGWQGFRARASASVVLPPAPLAPNARGEPRQQTQRGTSEGCWRRLQSDVRYPRAWDLRLRVTRWQTPCGAHGPRCCASRWGQTSPTTPRGRWGRTVHQRRPPRAGPAPGETACPRATR